MLDVLDVTKRYGNTPVLTGVTFHLYPGEKALLLGPNGAGKSTLLRIIANLISPDAGTVLLAGYDVVSKSSRAARCFGYVGHASFLYQDLSVEDNLRFYAGIYGLSQAEANERIAARMEEVGLASRRGERLGLLSEGQVKRLSIARALLHEPAVLLLDEPFATLDGEGRSWLVRWLKAERSRTVLLATHQLDFSQQDADRVLSLVEGCIVEGRSVNEPRQVTPGGGKVHNAAQGHQ